MMNEQNDANNLHEGTIGLPVEGSRKIKMAHYWVKVSRENDKNGIDGGKITMLMIEKDGKDVVNYDKGWNQKPDEKDKDSMRAYEICMRNYN